MTVNLTRIYTKLGDGGETHLGDMSRVPKTHPRIEAYGVVDELNAHLGLAREYVARWVDDPRGTGGTPFLEWLGQDRIDFLNEPGWALTVDRQRIDYVGDYGETRVSEPTPPGFEPRPGSWSSGRLASFFGGVALLLVSLVIVLGFLVAIPETGRTYFGLQPLFGELAQRLQ